MIPRDFYRKIIDECKDGHVTPCGHRLENNHAAKLHQSAVLKLLNFFLDGSELIHDIKFKLAVLVYKSVHGLTAPYLTDDCQLVANSGRRRLRSADVDTCIIPRTNTWLGDRSFAVTGPQLWNTLPVELCQPDIELVTFRRLLKTHLFKCYPGA